MALTASTLATRARYVPQGALKIKCKAAPAEVHIWTDRRGRPCAMAFGGERSKPDFHFSFHTEKSREAKVREYFDGQAARIQAQAGRDAKRKAFLHTLKVGDILTCGWGYEQTNRDFYQVVSAKGKSVTIRKIGAEKTYDTSGMSGHSMPCKDHFTGPEMSKIVQEGNSVKIASYASASLWEGRPAYFSEYA